MISLFVKRFSVAELLRITIAISIEGELAVEYLAQYSRDQDCGHRAVHVLWYSTADNVTCVQWALQGVALRAPLFPAEVA
jgi:hypothetical protein